MASIQREGRINPSGGGGIGGTNLTKRTPLVISPNDLDVPIEVSPTGKHGHNAVQGQNRKTGLRDYNK